MKKSKARNLDIMPTKKLVELFINEELNTIKSIKKQTNNIATVINQIKTKLDKSGRVIYIGSGTSGRLGILDAVECSPTFSTNSFVGVTAGGKSAFLKAKEGAEDNEKSAIKDLKKLKVSRKDVVVGISASGETPYTKAAIKYSRKIKALTIGITSNPKSSISKTARFVISLQPGSELIQGSSRLKSGTAQKIILNMISSITMIKSGKVYRDLMIDVKPTNKKLVKRAINIISIVCNTPFNQAKRLFEKAQKNTKAAIIMHKKRCNLMVAKHYLKQANGNLRQLIG